MRLYEVEILTTDKDGNINGLEHSWKGVAKDEESARMKAFAEIDDKSPIKDPDIVRIISRPFA